MTTCNAERFLNAALRAARGVYAGFLDGDGVWLDPELPRFCDLDLCLRLALLGPGNVHAIPEELTHYRSKG